MWIGTLQFGVARYDGDSLQCFTMNSGLVGNGVVSMVEEGDGTLWFGTHSGLGGRRASLSHDIHCLVSGSEGFGRMGFVLSPSVGLVYEKLLFWSGI